MGVVGEVGGALQMFSFRYCAHYCAEDEMKRTSCHFPRNKIEESPMKSIQQFFNVHCWIATWEHVTREKRSNHLFHFATALYPSLPSECDDWRGL